MAVKFQIVMSLITCKNQWGSACRALEGHLK